MYDQDWYIGMIVDRSDENSDVLVKFMRCKSLYLSWNQDHGNQCWIPFQDILCTISVPEMQGQSG